MQRKNFKNTIIGGLLVFVGMTNLASADEQIANTAQPYGYWMTQGGNVLVEIKECDLEKICADIIWTDELAVNTRLIGAQVLKGFQYKNGSWRGGRVYDVASGRAYFAKIKTRGDDSMILNTCALGKCYPQIWTRANKVELETAQLYASNR